MTETKLSEKQLKDYLHLYLGCECQWVENQRHFKVGDKIILGLDDIKYWSDKIKPVLRPLSDMTVEETRTVNVFGEMLPDHHAGEAMGATVRYLLSKHFDLFGLIEAGLAIDKTKL